MQFTDAYLHGQHTQDGYWQPLALEPVVPKGTDTLYEGLMIHLDHHNPGTLADKPGQSRLGAKDALERSGQRLRRYYGARLRREGMQGLTGIARENTLEPRASGGADLVHYRAKEGTVILPLEIRQPSKAKLDEMVWLVDHICTWFRYQQLRTITSDGRDLTKRLVYREGLETPVQMSPGSVFFMLSFDDVDAYWYASIKPHVKQLDPPDKKFITAYEGEPATEEDALAQVEEYFDGDTEDEMGYKNGYEFPFFPIFISGSTVQDQVEIFNRSDYPVWLKYEFEGPGEDPEVRLCSLAGKSIPEHKQPRILVETSTDEGLIIDSAEGTQMIYRENKDGSYENLFPLTTSMDWFSIPARTHAKVHVSVVNAKPESRVRITGMEQTSNSGIY